jgi:3-oxoadipate enol-lactonase
VTSTAGLRWRVDGVGRNLVLIHGWALSLDYWDTMVPLLAQHCRVLRFDRRGFGHSPGQPSLAADAIDIFELMDAADMTQATLLGMSQGARVAVAAALAQPARVKAVILDGPPWLGAAGAASSEAKEEELPLRRLRTLLQTQGEAALQTAMLQLPLLRLARGNPAATALLQRCVGTYRGLDLAATAHAQPALAVAELTMPLLIINGERESAQRLQAGTRLQQQVPASRRCVIEGAGHLASLDAPEHYRRAILDFLAPA